MRPRCEARPNVVIEMGDPAIRVDMSERVFNPTVYEGHEGSRRFWAEIDEVWDDFRGVANFSPGVSTKP